MECGVSLSLEWVCLFHSDYDGVRTETKLEMLTDQQKGTSRLPLSTLPSW